MSEKQTVEATAGAVAVVEAAEAFVATTSYYRQPKESREALEALAVALLKTAAAQS